MTSPTRFKEKTCPQCSANHRPGTSAQWCADCRAAGYPKRRQSTGVRVNASLRFDCPNCGQEFAARTACKIYCSPACKRQFANNAIVGQAVCAGCGQLFNLRRGQCRKDRQPAQPSCSHECKLEISSQRVAAEYASGQRISYLPNASWRQHQRQPAAA